MNSKRYGQDLEVWKQGQKIQRLIREITKSFPNYEKYRLSLIK